MTTEKETVQTQEAPQPKLEDSPEFREALQKAIRQGTSKYQRQASEAAKAAKAADARVQAIQDELAQAKESAEIARLAGDDVDEQARVRRILERERAAEKTLKEANEQRAMGNAVLRDATIQTLHVQYGIPIDELEDLETAEQMELAAVKYENQHLKKGTQKAAPKKEEEEEKESKPLDTGEGRLGTTKIPAPGTKEFEEFYSRVKAGFR